ncbi:MAG: hypothetical protein IPI21_02765 [Propionivibrio sp.]|nr:hypothetical protein [Propionivibrio sp.]
MKTLFIPAISLLNRLGYTKKFAIMGILALVAISMLAMNLYHSLTRVIHRSQQELVGIEMIKPIASLMQHLQAHRGLSAGVLNGDEEMEERRAPSKKRSGKRSASWRPVSRRNWRQAKLGRRSWENGRRSRKMASRWSWERILRAIHA